MSDKQKNRGLDSSPVNKRGSWLDMFVDYPMPDGVDKERARLNTSYFDEVLYNVWRLGHNAILVWTPNGEGVDLAVCTHSEIAKFVHFSSDPQQRDERAAYIDSLLSIDKRVDREDFSHICALMNLTPTHIELPFTPGKHLDLGLMSAIVRRYGISLVDDRAVILFDIVGFSLLSPLEQMTQLTSLSCSINLAYSKLVDSGLPINFARTTTGDGFYIWNRERGIDANVELYFLLLMILADNSLERQNAELAILVPELRAVMHVGSHYEFYQSEALSPGTFSYIVGEVTIGLARIIEHALPGQLLIGDFTTPMRDYESAEIEIIDTTKFVEYARQALLSLVGTRLSDDSIVEIGCYLTGKRCAEQAFTVARYELSDKHGLSHFAYNAKLNIHRESGNSIFIGMQDKDLGEFAGATLHAANPQKFAV